MAVRWTWIDCGTEGVDIVLEDGNAIHIEGDIKVDNATEEPWIDYKVTWDVTPPDGWKPAESPQKPLPGANFPHGEYRRQTWQ